MKKFFKKFAVILTIVLTVSGTFLGLHLNRDTNIQTTVEVSIPEQNIAFKINEVYNRKTLEWGVSGGSIIFSKNRIDISHKDQTFVINIHSPNLINEDGYLEWGGVVEFNGEEVDCCVYFSKKEEYQYICALYINENNFFLYTISNQDNTKDHETYRGQKV